MSTVSLSILPRESTPINMVSGDKLQINMAVTVPKDFRERISAAFRILCGQPIPALIVLAVEDGGPVMVVGPK